MKNVNALQKLLEFKDVINSEFESEIKDLIESILNYHRAIVLSELARLGLTNDNYEEMDKKRSISHNSMISKLHFLVRKINEYEGIKGSNIYSYPPETIRNRVAIANWSIELINEILKNRAI